MAKHLSQLISQLSSANSYRAVQLRMLVLTWLAYVAYYLVRKHFAVVKMHLHSEFDISITALGCIDTAYLAIYALGQFISGSLGDRFGARVLLTFGMIGTALCSILFGLSSTAILFAIVFGLNGFFQSTGWPNSVKAISPWLSNKNRGKTMGIWSTNCQIGGIIATAVATLNLMFFGWRATFFVPALAVLFMAGLVYLFLQEKPEKEFVSREHSFERSSSKVSLRELAKNKGIWCLGFSNFGLMLIRYSLLFWLPFYLFNKLHFSLGASGFISIFLELGGTIGAMAVGIISDKYFAKNRVRLVLPMIVILCFVLVLYRQCAHLGMVANAIGIGLIGFFVCGPDNLIGGTCAQELGGDRNAGSIAGFINSIGSMGAMLQGIVTALIAEYWGWDKLFYFFIFMALFSGLALIPLAYPSLRKKRPLQLSGNPRIDPFTNPA